jgi:hypothetical protein
MNNGSFEQSFSLSYSQNPKRIRDIPDICSARLSFGMNVKENPITNLPLGRYPPGFTAFRYPLIGEDTRDHKDNDSNGTRDRENIVAEGIEMSKQLQELRSFMCKYGQGVYLSKPVDVKQIEIILNNQAVFKVT